MDIVAKVSLSYDKIYNIVWHPHVSDHMQENWFLDERFPLHFCKEYF